MSTRSQLLHNVRALLPRIPQAEVDVYSFQSQELRRSSLLTAPVINVTIRRQNSPCQQANKPVCLPRTLVGGTGQVQGQIYHVDGAAAPLETRTGEHFVPLGSGTGVARVSHNFFYQVTTSYLFWTVMSWSWLELGCGINRLHRWISKFFAASKRVNWSCPHATR